MAICLKNNIVILQIGLVLSFGAMAEGAYFRQSNPDTKKINAAYRVAKIQCFLRSGIAEDQCLARAKSVRKKAISDAMIKHQSEAKRTILG